MIPGPKVGLIIGKGGETIKQLQVILKLIFSNSNIWKDLCKFIFGLLCFLGEVRNKNGGGSRWSSTREREAPSHLRRSPESRAC